MNVVVNVVIIDVVATPSRFLKVRVDVTTLSTTEGASSSHRARNWSKGGPSASVQPLSLQQSWQVDQNFWKIELSSHISVELWNCASR